MERIKVRVYAEDLFFVRSLLRRHLDTGTANGTSEKANRMLEFLRCIVDHYQEDDRGVVEYVVTVAED